MRGLLHRGLTAGILFLVLVFILSSGVFASPSDEEETEIEIYSEVAHERTYGLYNSSGHYLGEFLGITRAQLVSSMNSLEASHGNNYYLNTRYVFSNYENDLIWPKGRPRSDGHTGFNCAGFVARAVIDAGGDLSELRQYGSTSRGASGADCWLNYVVSKGIKYYKYSSLPEMLADGRAEQGDIIFTYPVRGFLPGSRDTHLGIYWGSYPGQDLMWQSIDATPGNLIMQCLTGAPESDVYLFKLGNGRTYDWIPYNGKWYLKDYAGRWQKGWVKVKGYWYYFDSSGAMLTGWQKIGGKWYLLGGNNDGHMYTGWHNLGGKWYFLDYYTGAMATGWKGIKGYWYLFDSNGVMQSGWQKIGNNWYLLGNQSDGHMFVGWQNVGGKWYFFNGTGEMLTGWKKITVNWYYLGDDGVMQTGWKQFGDDWFFLKQDGSMAANEWYSGYWFNKDGTWTYEPRGKWNQNKTGWWFSDSSGWYAKNTTLRIDNSYYKFNAAGYWTK